MSRDRSCPSTEGPSSWAWLQKETTMERDNALLARLERSGIDRRTLLRLAGAGAAAGMTGMVPRTARAKVQPGTLRVGLGSRDMGSLHPHVATGANDTPVINTIFSGLLRYAAPRVAIDAIEPDLAERWEASSDQKTYTFHLRKGAK